ncbi:MAG: sodium:solute symporter [Planctomycetota bacterium]
MAISSIDFAIILFYILAMVIMGVWMGKGDKSLDDYLLGGRRLPWWAILGSIVATETSTATFLSVPGIAYAEAGDLRFLQIAVGFLIGRMVVSIVLLPMYFRGDLFTAYQVLQQRFGGATKQTASVLFLVTRNLGDGLRLFLAGVALSKVLGIGMPTCVVIVGVATILYTFFGGMKAVIWSDCIQFVIYMTGGVVALMLLVSALDGGLNQWIEFGRSTGRFRVFDFRGPLSFDGAAGESLMAFLSEPYTFWSGVIGGAVLTLGTHGTDQMMVQRYLCATRQFDAARALVLSGAVVFIQFALFLLLGVALACYYSSVEPRQFDRGDEVFATYIVDQMPLGLVGVTLAAVFAAAMSTLSSSLNSSATSATNDLIKPWLVTNDAESTSQPGDGDSSDPLSDRRLLKVSRVLTIVFGVIQIAIGIGAIQLASSVVSDALAIAGFTAGVLLGVFLLGVATRQANQTGTLIGMVVGILVLAVVKFATPIAWTWYALIGSIVTFSVGWLASQFASKMNPPEVVD